MSLQTAITRISAILGDISGIKSAPEQPPESSSAFPFGIVYPDSGQIEAEYSFTSKAIHNLAIEVHFNRSNLPQAVKEMVPVITLIKQALIEDPTLAGTVDTIVATSENRIEYTVINADYAGVQTLVLRFVVTVKVRE